MAIWPPMDKTYVPASKSNQNSIYCKPANNQLTWYTQSHMHTLFWYKYVSQQG